MRKKIVKLVLTVGVILAFIFWNANISYATVSGNALTGIFNGKTIGGGVDVSGGEKIATKVIGMILVVTRNLAVGISIIVLTWLGIKYMSAAPSEKASIKNQMITFTIGAIVVVAAATILELIRDYVQTI